MSAKRAATSDLNHENWDQEDPADSEQMGTFPTTTKEILEKRVIRTAKRRNQASTTNDESKKNHFSGFGGFNKPTPSSFDFLANLTNGSNTTNGAGTKSDTAVTSSIFSSKPTAPSTGLFGIPAATSKPAFGGSGTSPFVSIATKTEIPSMTFSSSKADSTVSDSPFKIQPVSSSADSNKPSKAQVTSTIFGVSSTSPNQKSETSSAFKQPVSSTSTISQNTATIATQSNSSKDPPFDKEAETEKARNRYYSRLKGLNESVSSWIVKHVEMTPLCFLSPIFKDYENYLKDIQEEYEAAKAEIEAKTKKQNSEAKPVFATKDSGGTSLFSKSTSFAQEAKTNQPFGTNTTSNSNTSTATNTVFGQSLSSNPKSQTNTTQSSLFGKTDTPSQGISFGTKPAETATETPVAPPSKEISFGVKPAETASENTVSTPNKGFSFGSTSSPTSSAFAANPSNADSPSKGFSFMSSTATTSPNASLFAASAANSTPPSKGFSFGMTTAATSPTNSTAPTTAAAPFSFGVRSGAPFSFSSQQQNTKSSEQKEEEEDQPPKVEFTPVVEENSVFDKKCKIFVKKDGNFADKGVGTLYIKKIEESGKHQLLVRANTNLGTILLNLILSASVPIQRTGKNNVMLVCIPTPEAKSPTPVLIRVKTTEEADELLDILNKYKS